jgi:hypothetical protein
VGIGDKPSQDIQCGQSVVHSSMHVFAPLTLARENADAGIAMRPVYVLPIVCKVTLWEATSVVFLSLFVPTFLVNNTSGFGSPATSVTHPPELPLSWLAPPGVVMSVAVPPVLLVASVSPPA